MPRHHRHAVLLLPTLIAGTAITGIASPPQPRFDFTNTGQALGEDASVSIALGDLDGDDDLDAMIVNCCGETSAIWINDGNGTFNESGQELGADSLSRSASLGDLDGDGDLDAMFVNYNNQPNTVWFNDGNGIFSDSGQELGNSFSYSVALGDVDGDGDLDAMVANDLGQSNTVWTNDGNGTFTDSGQRLGKNDSRSVAFGDINRDGDLDAMVANSGGPNTVWFNDGNGTFIYSGQALGDAESNSVALGDLDGDGHLDATFANGDFKGIHPNTVWFNNGSGTFTNSGQALGTTESNAVVLGDVDGDGDLDAMVASYFDQPNIVWSNDGTGTFTNSGQSLGTTQSYSIASGDLDGDGDRDAMVVGSAGPNTVWTNTVTNTGVCCTPSGCMLMTENLSGLCEGLGGIYLPEGSCEDCPTPCPADFNGDGVVDGMDLAVVLAAWGISCGE